MRGAADKLVERAQTAKDVESTGMQAAEPPGGRRIDDATPVVSSAAPPGVTHLPRLPPLGDIVDAAQRGASPAEITALLKGLEGPYGKFRVEGVTLQRGLAGISRDSDGNAWITVRMRVHNADGAVVGSVERRFGRDAQGRLVVVHQYTSLVPAARRQGFATAFNRATEAYYRASGVDRILVNAEKDGGLVWAKAGFGWDTDGYSMIESGHNISDRAERLIRHGNLTDAEIANLREVQYLLSQPPETWPTPAELASRTADGRPIGETLMRDSVWAGMKKL
ncbi:hypothetical protein [Nocardia stercoris]|nr:hypothetical protein [Nocardia stercoris]